MKFKKLTFENMSEIYHFTPQNVPAEEFSCEFSPLTLAIWADELSTEFAIFQNTLIIRTNLANFGTQYRFPQGENFKTALEQIFQLEKNPSFIGINKTQAAFIINSHSDYCQNSIRSAFDYCYETEKLRSLSGKKLQQKRNHFNAFSKAYPSATYIELNAEMARKCAEIYPSWAEEHSQNQSEMFQAEYQSLMHILTNWNNFQLQGGAIELNNQIIAFTISEQISDEIAIIHFEKADRNYRGSYAAINKWHAECINSKYINREDDSGIDGLRQAKLAYRPAFMVEKFWVANKPAMRRLILEQRKTLDPVLLTDEIDISLYQNIYIYDALQGEVQTSQFIANHPDKNFFTPQITETNELTFTPQSPIPNSSLLTPHLFIVPALAYSKNGTRLGFGGGHYDKFLKNYPNTPKIGIIQEQFLFDNLPTEPHDIPVNQVITISPPPR